MNTQCLSPMYRILSFCILCFVTLAPVDVVFATHAATVNGEIESRPSPTFRRVCLAGTNAGDYCKQNAECPGSTCRDRNVFNMTVAILYDAPAVDITAIQNMISATSATLMDISDGQAEIGQATLHNNAVSTTGADLVVHPSTNPVWWQANSGHFRTGGFMEVSIDNITGAASPGPILAHEFVHLVFDARDEYETRAAGCGAVNGGGECPVAGAADGTCLMDGNGSEVCWGQGDPLNLADLTGGNHDPSNVTEQSVCRGNRSCWNQLAWSWPTTILMPVGAPDPAANGAVANPTNFIVTDNTARVVLVLDESGSMSLESPSRMERLKVAAGDFITTAENGIELGLVSYATDAEVGSGRANVPIAALGANRNNWNNPVAGLSPSTRTNIGAGLQEAQDMIVAAGGVTANTYVVLMTDGLNNEPAPQANADTDLQAKIDALLASGIPVFVTCTGGDLGLQSQCAEIASGTNGFNSDSAQAARLPQTFVDFQERITGHQGVSSVQGTLSKATSKGPLPFYIDDGSESASFSLLWENASAGASVVLIDPAGNSHQTAPIPQGVYARIKNPLAGEWKMNIDPRGADSPFTARAYVQNRINNLVVSTRWPSLKPGEEQYVYAFAKSRGGSITEPGAKMVAQVSLPDGSSDTLELFDNGRDAAGHGDDIAGDGIFTGVYTNTTQKGAYGFQVSADIDQWHQGTDAHERDDTVVSARFMRETRTSSAVHDPSDQVTRPEDDHKLPPGAGTDPQPQPGSGIERWLLIAILVLLFVGIVLLLRCCCGKRV